jgi:proline iminopeptidase
MRDRIRMSAFSSYDNTEIWYELAGEGDPLVVLPGGPGMDLRYLGDLGGLDRHSRLILTDTRAAGRSGVPEDRDTVSFVAQARDLEALRQHLGLEHFDLLAPPPDA